MINQSLLDEMMDALIDENREAAQHMLDAMDDSEKMYFAGYVDGYVSAIKQFNGIDGDVPEGLGFCSSDDYDRMASV